MGLGNLIFQFSNEVKSTIRKIEKILLKINSAETLIPHYHHYYYHYYYYYH